MNILYYIPDITQKNGGIRQYACALLKILSLDKNNTYFVLHNVQDPVILSLINDNNNLKLIPLKIGIEKKFNKILLYSRILLNYASVKLNLGININVVSYVERICNKYKIDLVYCPYQFYPQTTRKTITTLHDVQEIHFPEFFTPSERLERAEIHKTLAEKSTLIVVSYEHIKKDLIKYFNRNEENVLTCLLSMENLWFDRYINNNIDLDSYKLPNDFIFYPAVTWEHKNHISILKALSFLRDKYSIKFEIIFTGFQTTFFLQIKEIINQLNLHEQVHFMGVVNEEVLYVLYKKTKAVVIPTLYEAGSFPLMESILMNIPVICSNVTSLPETIGDRQYVFDPINIEDMAEKIKKIFFDKEYRHNNIINSQIQTKKLRNTDALNKLVCAITETGKN